MDELEGVGRRAKRMKIESAAMSSSLSGLENSNSKAADQPIQKRSSIFDSSVDKNNRRGNITMLKHRKQHRPLKENNGSYISPVAKSRSSSASMQTRPISGTEGISLAPVHFANDELDVSSSPSDPFDLAIWVAQAVRRIHNGVHPSLETDVGHSEMKRRSSSRTLGIHLIQNDKDADVPKTVERENKRDEQRLRKQRWRSEHREESTTAPRPHSLSETDSAFPFRLRQ